MQIKWTDGKPFVYQGRAFYAGTALDLPDAEARAMIDAGQAVPWVVVKFLRTFNQPQGVTYAAGEVTGWDEKTADMLIKAGVAERCSIPS